MRFPCETYPVRDTATGRYLRIARPVIGLRVNGPSGADNLNGLLDTGADDTPLPDYLVKALGVEVLSGGPAIIIGIDGGKTRVRYGRVDFSLPGYRWSSTVGFHAGFHTILGHSGFLEYFTATFNGRRGHVTLTPNGTATAPTGGPPA